MRHVAALTARHWLTSNKRTPRGKRPSPTALRNRLLTKSNPNPTRGEVWTINLDPTVGREQAGSRPALVVSVDPFNSSARDLVVVVPITGTDRSLPTHVAVAPPEGGLAKVSVIMTEQIRSVSKDRLGRRIGSVTPATLEHVGQNLALLLGIG